FHGRWNQQRSADHFRKLEGKVGEDRDRISRVLDWYCANATKLDKPKVKSSRWFCDEKGFLWIEDLMNADINRNPKVSERAARIASDLATLGWPKGSKAQLPAFVQRTVDNVLAFQNAAKKVMETSPSKFARR